METIHVFVNLHSPQNIITIISFIIIIIIKLGELDEPEPNI